MATDRDPSPALAAREESLAHYTSWPAVFNESRAAMAAFDQVQIDVGLFADAQGVRRTQRKLRDIGRQRPPRPA